MSSTGLCVEQLKTEGEQFNVEFYLLPLDGFDVVLGVWTY